MSHTYKKLSTDQITQLEAQAGNEAAKLIDDLLDKSVDPDLIQSAVNDWLEDHPEATTTVQDGTITKAKLNTALQNSIDSIPAVDDTLATTGAAADAKKTGDEISDLSSGLSGTQEWLGFPFNLFAGTFTTTHSSNWEIEQTGNTVTITHLTQYSSGEPKTGSLALEAGQYNFSADYNGGTNLLALYKGTDTFVKLLSESDTIQIDSGETYYLRIGSFPDQGDSITVSGIAITSAEISGVIPDISAELNVLTPAVSLLTEKAKAELNGASQSGVFINSNGAVAEAGTPLFYVVSYSVDENAPYWITASTKWANCYYAFYNSSNVLLSKSDTSPADLTSIENVPVTSPQGASILRVSWYSEGEKAKVVGIQIANGKPWTGKTWVCVGDSLTEENAKTSKHYFDYVSEATGIATVNMGVSGSGYARLSEENKAFYQRISSCPVTADVVTIFGSFNDLGAGLSVGSVDDTGTTTLAGCINTTITNLQTLIPLVNLGIVSPTPWDTTQPTTSGQAYDYVQMLKAICERRSIPFLDLWHCSGLRPWDADFRTAAYSKDGGSGTHPDENGHKLIAPRFEAFLNSLLLR